MSRPDHPYTIDRLQSDLTASGGVEPGRVVIVHASVKSVGPIRGGVDTLLEAILETVTPAGAVLMPAFSRPQPDGVFDVRTTPSRTGLLTETLRRHPDAGRSLHPTHSIAGWGERAPDLLEGHDRTSGLGRGSPLHKAAEAGALVLMIGCGLTRCSLIHVAEALVRPPYFGVVCYPGYDRTLTLIDHQGRRRTVPPRDVPTDSAGFTVVGDELQRRGQLRRCRLGDAEVLRFAARDGLGAAADLLRYDPAALLCREPTCEVCAEARRAIGEPSPGERGGSSS